MIAPPVNLIDAIAVDDHIIGNLASQLTGERYRRETRLVLAFLIVTFFLLKRKSSPGLAMQNIKQMDWLCACSLILPALIPFFPGKTLPALRLALHVATLAGFSTLTVASDKAERVVVTEYMYRLLAAQQFTALSMALAPLLRYMPFRPSTDESACAGCGTLKMIMKQRLQPCNHFCCYVCTSSISKCGFCGVKVEGYAS